jgi:tRNA nucleotidyltransferase (CCA-adding enzyme)
MSQSIRLFKVGGCVRDELLKRKPNDIDYAVECQSYSQMKQALLSDHVQIFHEIPSQVTIRGKRAGQPCDFVMCTLPRAEPKKVNLDQQTEGEIQPGTILDDLGRRDFRFNSIAKSPEGEFIDPYNGKKDIANKVIALTAGLQTLHDDPLRLVRALRFQVTLPGEWKCDEELEMAMQSQDIAKLLENVAIERIQVELDKAFSANTPLTLQLLTKYPLITQYMFSGQHARLWLKPSVVGRPGGKTK